MTPTGSCYCEKIKFEVDDNANDAVVCYCRSCQKCCSSHSLNIRVPSDKIKVTAGEPKSFNDTKTDSGKAMKRFFCGDCGSPLWSNPDAAPGNSFLKVGVLDDMSDVRLVAEVYCDNRHSFEKHPSNGQKQFTKGGGSKECQA